MKSGTRSYFTKNDIRRLKKRMKLGQTLRYKKNLVYNENSGGLSHQDFRWEKGTIIGIYDWFVFIETPKKLKTSVLYVDLLIWSRERKHK